MHLALKSWVIVVTCLCTLQVEREIEVLEEMLTEFKAGLKAAGGTDQNCGPPTTLLLT